MPEQELSTRVRSYLTSQYRGIQLPAVKWYRNLNLPIDDLMVDLTMKEIHEHGNKITDNTPFSLEEIFNPAQGQKCPPVRMLVEGPPFSGKTALAYRLVQDWANYEDYSSNFQFAYFIIPEFVKQDPSLSSFIIEMSRVDNMEDRWFQQMLSNRESNILFVVDNLDEYDEVGKKEIVPLLNRQMYPKATVIALGRTGVFPTYERWITKPDQPRTSVFKLFTAIKDTFTGYKSIKWSKRIYLEGLGPQARQEYLEVYLGDVYFPEYVDAHLEHLYDEYIEPFYQLPIYLFYLARIHEETDFTTLKSKTLFFHHIMNIHAGVHHFFNKKKVEKHEKNIDIFENSTFSLYRKMFKNLGELCLTHYQSGDYEFTKDELIHYCNIETAMCMSILKRDLVPLKNPNGNENPRFRILHEILAEFCIAYFLSTDQKFLRKTLYEQRQELKMSFLQPKTNRWVLLFLVGLLKEKAGIVFKFLEPFAFVYKHNFKLFLPYVQECQEHLQKLFQDLKVFLPTDWWIHHSQYTAVFARSELHKTLVQYAMEAKWFKSLRWDLGMPANVPDQLVVGKLELTVNMRGLLGLKSFSGKRIKCDEFVLIFRGQRTRIAYERFISALNEVKANVFRFYANDEDLAKLIPHMNHLIQYRADLEFHIHCTLERFPKDFCSILLRALNKNPSRFHTLAFYLNPLISPGYFPKIERFTSNIFEEIFPIADKLKTFNFSGDMEVPFHAPLQSICTLPKRVWSSIGFEWLQVRTEDFPLPNKLNLEHLFWSNVKEDTFIVNLLQSCSGLKALTCHATSIKRLSHADIGSCIASCESLYVIVDTTSTDFFEELSSFKRLKKLTLQFDITVENDWKVGNLSSCLKNLSLSRLSLLSPPLNILWDFLNTTDSRRSSRVPQAEDVQRNLGNATLPQNKRTFPTHVTLNHLDTFHIDLPNVYTEILHLQENLLRQKVVSMIEISCWLHMANFKVVESISNAFDSELYDIAATNCEITKPSDPEPIWRHMFRIQRRDTQKTAKAS